MYSTKYSGLSILLILALMVSMLAVLVPAAPAQATATSAIINQPTTDNVTLTKGTGGSVTVKYYLIGTNDTETVHIYITNGTTNIFDSGNLDRDSDNTTLNSEICAINAATAGNYYVNIYVNSALITSQSGTTTVIIDNTAPVASIALPNASTCSKGAIGQVIALQWSATDAASSDNVSISADLSIDGGANYPTSLLASVSYSQTTQLFNYSILAPISSSICKIRLKAVDRAGNDSGYVYSSLFSVLNTAPTATVSAPAGGETWNGASSQTITGTLTGSGTTLTYMIELLKAGVNTENITTSWQTATLTGGVYSISYPWTVSNNDRGATFRVGIYARDCAGNISTLGTSAATFTIKDVTAPTVTVSAPTTGQTLYASTTPTISWTQTDNVPVNLASAQLYYTPDGGANWYLMGAGTVTQGANTYSAWTVPSISSTNCKIKVVVTDGETPGNVTTAYSGTFTISSGGVPTVILCTPNGGESWQVGSIQNITWTASDSLDATARMTYVIQLSTDSGGTWPTTIATLSNQTQASSCGGSYSWAVSDSAGTTAMIKITATNAAGSSASDQSNAVFTITAASCAVETGTIALTSGWNLISLPLWPTTTNIDTLLSSQMANVISVWYYTGGGSGSWLSYAPGAPSTLTTLEGGKAYWVNMNTPRPYTLTFQGRKCPCPPASPTTITVSTAGWNMIGFKSSTPKAVSSYFTSLGTCGTAYLAPINGYTSGAWSSVNCSDNMTSGRGYWVYINSTGIINPGCE